MNDYDYRPYIISIAAIFIALALGILIGITFGENMLVSNQREMIEFIQEELKDLQEKYSSQQRELQRWEALAPLVMKSFQKSLLGQKVLVVTSKNPPAGELIKMLGENGVEISLAEFPAGEQLADPRMILTMAKELIAEQETAGCSVEGLAAQETFSGGPDWIIIYLSTPNLSPENLLLGRLGEELFRLGEKIIIAYPENRDSNEELSPEIKPCIIDQLDTFWGKLILLETLSNNF